MKITFGTATELGGVTTYGQALIAAMRSVDPLLEIQTIPTKGVLENVSLLESGELDIGLAYGEVAYELFMGVGRSPTKLKVISAMYSTPGMFVVRADSRFHRIADLKDRPVVWGGRNSAPAVQARYAMDGLGLDIDKDFRAIYTDSLAEGSAMVVEGRAAALWGSGVRWAGFVQVAGSTRGARFVVPDFGEIERIHNKHNFLMRLTVPGGLYRGQYDPIDTVGSWSFILARADLDESVGYRLASSLYKIDRVGASSRQLAETTPRNTLAAIPGPDVLQQGVIGFYKKIELLK